jgi:hypothetical protein
MSELSLSDQSFEHSNENKALKESYKKNARIITNVFFVALFIDYYGGFGIKYFAFAIAVFWLFAHKNSFGIFRNVWADILVLLIIPIIFIILRLPDNYLFTSKNVDLSTYISRSYSTISSVSLLILYPLFREVGTSYVISRIIIGLRITAIFVIAIYAFHTLGVIDVRDFKEISDKYRIGVYGTDTRMMDDQFLDEDQKIESHPYVAHALIITMGYEVLSSIVATAYIFIALLIVSQRGLTYGAIVIAVLTIVLTKRISIGTVIKKYVLITLMLGIVLIQFESIRYRLTENFIGRTNQLINVEDASTLVRLGHINGYINLLQDQPSVIFVGAGPMGEIYNLFMGSTVQLVEMSIMNIAIWFGIPYACLFIFWLFRSPFRLWRLRNSLNFRKEDIALIVGASIFWIVGNTNPLMTTPLSIITFMLVSLRRMEIIDNGK